MESPDKKILVTAALPYANGKIHLGHLAGAYIPADMYVRYQRSKKRDVLFICGSDEHGVPITITAEKEGKTPQQVVDEVHEQNKRAFELCGISFDNYSRTSLPLHHETAKEFFLKFYNDGILVEKKEQQFYDEKASMFLPDRYVEGICPVCKNPEARGDQCERCGSYYNAVDLIDPRSKITGNIPTMRETKHWYFPLGNFQQRLEEYIRNSDAKEKWKENVLSACKGWFNDVLRDRAVTRDLNWGVPVPLPGYENKVLYVWFEAVLGYISATKEWSKNIGRNDAWKDYWLNENTKYVAFIGKDNIVFHCIVFPAMLMAWNDISKEKFVLPTNVPANEFLNFEGQKFSKSKNWGIDVEDFLQKFPPDLLRYTLAGILPESHDADFYWKDFQSRTNNELADILGNFVHRSLTFLHQKFEGKIPQRGELSPLDNELIALLESTPDAAGKCFEEYKFRDGVTEIMNLARFANKYFNDSAPWSSIKNNPIQCATTLNLCLQTVRSLAILLEPVIPFTSAKIFTMLNLKRSASAEGWESAKELVLPVGHSIQQPEILFKKIEDEMIETEIKQMGDSAVMQTAPSSAENIPSTAISPAAPVIPSAPITIDDFKKIQLRIGTVLACEQIPKSKKLLKLKVSIGTEERQVLAGIAEHYQPEQLLGKSVVIVVNLEPAKLMGHESQGMLLAASDSNGNLAIISPEKSLVAGSIVK